MTNLIDVRVTIPHQGIPVVLTVHGEWRRGHIDGATVQHGRETITATRYPVLVEAAVKLAEAKYAEYREDQAAIKYAIVSRLCGY